MNTDKNLPIKSQELKMNQIIEASSLRQDFRNLTKKQKLAFLNGLDEETAQRFYFDWEFWARDNQLAPSQTSNPRTKDGNWNGWLILAGRGFGKTRVGAEWVKWLANSGKYPRISLIGRTMSDVIHVMLNGESGLISCYPHQERPIYKQNKRTVEFPNGVIGTVFTAEEPDLLRGPQHNAAWLDELAAWTYAEEAFDNLMFGLRLGEHPLFTVTTTPRPTKIIKDLINDPHVYVTRGSTYDNRENLAANYIDKIVAKYEGTRLGRQELYGEVLDDNPNALWNRTNIDQNRVAQPPQLIHIVVGVDPAVTSNEKSNLTGIVVVGRGVDGHFYVLADASIKGKPHEWAHEIISQYYKFFANVVVGETNQGGDLIESMLRAHGGIGVPFASVRASQGKAIRAEPVSMLYEQSKVHHVGTHNELEDEICSWDPTIDLKSPDRMDALVWAITWLIEHTPHAAAGVYIPPSPIIERPSFWGGIKRHLIGH